MNKIFITAVKQDPGKRYRRTFESLAGPLVDPSEEGVLLCQQLPAFVKAQEVGEANPAVAVPCSYWEADVTRPRFLKTSADRTREQEKQIIAWHHLASKGSPAS